MKKKYIVDGKVYEVPDSESAAFLKDFPNAKVSYTIEGKEYQVPHQEIDAFETDMGLKKKEQTGSALALAGAKVGGKVGAATSNLPSGSTVNKTGNKLLDTQLNKAPELPTSKKPTGFEGNQLDPSFDIQKKREQNTVTLPSKAMAEVEITDEDIPAEIIDKKGYRNSLQNRLLDKVPDPVDLEVIAKKTGRPIEAISAYAQGRDGKGVMIEFDDVKAKKGAELSNLVIQANDDLKLDDKFEDIFSSPQSAKSYIDKIEKLYQQKADRIAESRKNEKSIRLQENPLDVEVDNIDNEIDAINTDSQNKVSQIKSILGKEIFKLIGDQVSNGTLPYDQGVKQGGNLVFGNELKNISEAKAKKSFMDSLGALNPLNQLGKLFRDEDKETKNLNSINAVVEMQLQREVQKNLIYEQAQLQETAMEVLDKEKDGTLTDEEKAQYKQQMTKMQAGIELKKQQYKTPQQLQKEYPILLKQSVIADINEFNAITSGNVKGYEKGKYSYEDAEFKGKSPYDDITLKEHLAAQGYDMRSQVVKDAVRNAEMGVDVVDYTFFGDPIGQIQDVLVNTLKGAGDILGVRNAVTILSEKKESELFPTQASDTDEYKLTGAASTAQNIVNTTGQVLGQGLIQFGTAGLGRLAGLSKLRSASAGFWTSGTVGSYDRHYKETFDLPIGTEAGRVAFASINAIFEGAAERLFPEVKLFQVPGFKDAISQLASKMSAGELTEKAAIQLLQTAKDKVLDYGTKFTKNILKEDAEEGLTAAFNDASKMVVGDPNMNFKKAAEDVKNTVIQTTIGTLFVGAMGAHRDVQSEKNISASSVIYNSAIYKDDAMDALQIGLDKGLYSEQEFNRKVSLLNTAEVGVSELKKAEQVVGRELSRPQKELFVANATAQKLLLESKSKTTDEATIEKIDKKLENLKNQQSQLLDDKVDFDEFGNVIVDTKLTVPVEGLDEQGIPIGDNVPAPEKIFTDFDKTLFHEGKLTPLGEDIKARIEKGEDITVLTARENTPENIQFIARTLGIPHENIKAGLDPDGKAAELTSYEGSKVFYDDNPDNVLAAQKTNARVIDTGLTTDEQRTPTLFRDLQETGNANEFLNPEKIDESIEEIQNQALTAPAGLKSKVGEKLTLELIARNTVEDINKAIDSWTTKVSGENVTATETKDADRHIRLLEKGLEEKAKIHESLQPSTVVEGEKVENNRKLDLAEIDKKISEINPNDATAEVQKNNLEKQRNEINDYYDNYGKENKQPVSSVVVDMSLTKENKGGVSINGQRGEPMWNLENPLAEKEVNGVTYAITDEALENNGKKVYRLYADKKLVSEHFSVEDAKKAVSELSSVVEGGSSKSLVDEGSSNSVGEGNLDISDKNIKLQNNEAGNTTETVPKTENKGTGNSTPTFSEKSTKEKPLNYSERVKQIEDVTDPYDRVLQHFANDGKIHQSAIDKLFGGKDARVRIKSSTESERRSRISLIGKNAPTIEKLAHDLWESDTTGKFDSKDYKDAIEEVLIVYNSKSAMQKDLVEKYDYDAAYEKYIEKTYGKETIDIVNEMSEADMYELLKMDAEKASEIDFDNYIESLQRQLISEGKEAENKKVENEKAETIEVPIGAEKESPTASNISEPVSDTKKVEEGGKEPPTTPKEPVKEENPERLSNKALATKLVNAKGTPEAAKIGIAADGLDYEPQSQKEAQELAKSIIDELGVDEAVSEAQKGKFGGDVNTLIQTTALDKLAVLEDIEMDKDIADIYAFKFAEIGIALDKFLRKQGQGISALNYFYKKSPLGIQLIENAKRKEDFENWVKPKEQSWKEEFEKMMKDPEFETFFKKEVQEELKKERATVRADKKEKVHKAIDEVMDKWAKKITPEHLKGTNTKGIDAEKVFKSVGAAMKAAYDVGEVVTKIVEDAVNYISDKLGTKDWGIEEFKKENWEQKLGKDSGYKESDTRHQTRIENLQKELQRIKERRSKEPKEKKESTREIPDDEKAILDEIEKEQSVWDAEKDAARQAANDYQKLETERNRQLKRVGEINEQIDTLRKGELPETKKLERKIDTPEIEALKAEKYALERSVRESIAHEKKMKDLEAELQRLKDRKAKEPKPDSKRIISEDERLLRDEIEAERKAWVIEENVSKLQDELQRVKDRLPKEPNTNKKRDLTETEKDLEKQIKAEKELWNKEVEPERKTREALKAAQKSLNEYERRISEKDISKTEDSDTPETPELKQLREKRDAKRKEYEAMKKEMLKPERDAEILRKRMEKFINRLKGLTERQKEELIQRTFKKIVEEGALEYPELRQMISEVTGRGPMTQEEAKRLRELVKDTNAVDEAGAKARADRTQESRKAFREAEIKAGKATKELNTLLYNRPNITKRLTSLMQLNTLGIPALVNNPIYNIWNQVTLRTPIGFTKTLIDKTIYYGAKAIGKEVLPETNILSVQVQKEFFKKLGLGTREAVGQFLTGLNRLDYISKEIQGDQIRPATAYRDLWAYSKGEKNLTKAQVFDKIIQASPPGITAEIIARTLNLGDKPQRFAAAATQSAAFAKSLGLKDIDFDLFIDFPREEAYRVYKAKGLSDSEAAQKADYVKDTIVKEGERSTFQQDNFVNNIFNRVFGKYSGGGNLAKATLISPYIKIPTNAYWSYYNIVNPEVAILQAMIYSGKAAIKQATGKRNFSFDKKESSAAKDVNEAKYWLAHAAVGMATRAVIIALVNAGIFISGNTGDDTKKEREGELFYEQQGSINISKLWALMTGENPDKVKNGIVIQNRWFGHWGTVGNTIARKYEDMTPEQKANNDEFWDVAIGGMELYALQDFEQGVFGNTSTLLSAMSAGIKSDKDLAGAFGYGLQQWGVNTLNMFTNIVHPAASAQIERAVLPYYSKQKSDTFLGELKNSMLTRSAPLRVLTGEYPPSKVGIWGDRLDKKDNWLMRLFGISKANDDNFAQPIYEDYKKTNNTKFFPPAVMPVITDNGVRQKLPVDDAANFEELVGHQRKALIAPYINNIAKFEGDKKYYSELDNDKKLDKLRILYDVGYEFGKALFLQKNPKYKVPDKTKKEEKVEDKEEDANEAFRKALKKKSPVK